MVRTWLKIKPESSFSVINIYDRNPLELNQIRNRIWLRGESEELSQFFRNVYGGKNLSFWAAAPDSVLRKHSGLPSTIVNILAEIVKADLQDFDFINEETNGENHKETWKEIAKENEWRKLVGSCVSETLALGDGAFKISFDDEVSGYPIIEFWGGDRVEFVEKHKRITQVIFKTPVAAEKGDYILKEVYKKNAIEYHLYIATPGEESKEVPLDTVPELAGYKPVTFNGDFMLAVPIMFYESGKYAGRGRSVFDNKTDDFDFLDEVISQWAYAFRKGRVKEYIPETLIPRDPSTGGLMDVDSFGTEFTKIAGSNKENANDQITTVQPQILYEAFVAGYSHALDMSLHGIISPATLGIDIGAMSSKEAQREKKDITGHTRNAITDALEDALPKLVNVALKAYAVFNSKPIENIECTLTFGEYAAPDFNDRLNSVSEAAAQNLMSVETMVEELWTNSKDEKWKKEEVARIMRDKGLLQAEEPSLEEDLERI